MNKYRVTVDKSFQPVPEAYVNGNQIQQILLNLLINARQAMPGGGRVMIRLAYDAENDMVDLVVRDNGVGIPADKLPKIFEPFYTTKSGPDASGKGGTGLGLSMCREIIEAHHGRIRVDSTVGKGTAFTLKLPTAGKAALTRPVTATRDREYRAPGLPAAAPAAPIFPTLNIPVDPRLSRCRLGTEEVRGEKCQVRGKQFNLSPDTSHLSSPGSVFPRA